jgi:hypothetical protein
MADYVRDPEFEKLLGPPPEPPSPYEGGMGAAGLFPAGTTQLEGGLNAAGIKRDPEFEKLLGPPPVDPHPAIDDLGRPFPGSGPDFDEYLRNSSVGKVLHAIGQGAADGWGAGNIGLSPETEDALKAAGVLPDVTKGQAGILRAFNEALIRPAAAAFDVANRALSAASGAGIAGLAQTATEIGGEQFGRGVGGLAEATLADVGSRIPEHAAPLDRAAPIDLPAARQAGIIGEPEGVYFGTREPTLPPLENVETGGAPANENLEFSITNPISRTAPEALGPGQTAPTIAPYAPTISPDLPALDVHDMARRIAPETFQEFDGLSAHQESLRQEIASQQAELQRQAEAQAPHQAEIADLESRLEDTTPRLAKKYEARLATMRAERDAFLNDDFTMAALTRDTPEIGALRQQLLETQYRMRDLAPDVTAAYRQAAERMPAEAEPPDGAGAAPAAEPPSAVASAEEPPAVAPRVVPVDAAKPVQAEQKPAQGELAPVANPGEPARTLPSARAVPASIAADVSQKLQAAGRPAEEADAAGQVTEAMWKTYADAWPGRGTAEELYARDAPEIRAGRQTARARQPEMAQGGSGRTRNAKLSLMDNGRNVITMMQTADASSYIHETGHDWLERMMRDAADPDAPAQMKADAAATRKYLGMTGDEATIPTRAHERFARSFERYFMEGRAPSQVLAVFGKFKQWLTSIYQTVTKIPGLRGTVSADIRDVFDRLLTREPEAAAIVPETVAEAAELPVGGTMQPAKPTPLYPKLPKEPTRLIGFLRRNGGIRDEGGEISNIIGGPKSRPGLINSTGMSLDEAAIKAHEAGYFPEHGEDWPSERDLLDAIAGDFKGEARYSAEDTDAVNAYHGALDHNAEVDRLARDHDIDTKGMTREQFFEALSKRVSEEQFYNEIRAMEESHEVEFGDLAADAREWVESHEGQWDDNRSQQEMEDRYGSENAARPAGQGVSDGQEPGATAGPSGPGEVGGGQGGRGPGDAGRPGETVGGDAGGGGADRNPQGSGAGGGAGPSADAVGRDGAKPASGAAGSAGVGDRPTDPQQPFRPATRVIDKAGNLRLDLLNTTEDIKQALRESAEQNNEFWDARRGVVSDEQVFSTANAVNATAAEANMLKLRQMALEDEIPPETRVRALRQWIPQVTAALREAAIKAQSGLEADILAYAKAADLLNMTQETLAGVSANSGRVQRAFRDLAANAAMAEARSLGAITQEITGRTLNQLMAQAKKVTLLETPADAAKFIRDAAKPSRGDMLLEYFVNSILSNPATHATYEAAMALSAGVKAVGETGLAAAQGSIREAFGSTEDRVYWGEVGAQLHGIIAGQKDGIKAAYRAWQSDMPTELPGEGGPQGSLLAAGGFPGGAIPGLAGTIVRYPTRGINALHSYSRTILYTQELATLAYRQAATEGLDGVAFAARVAELKMNPPEAMMAQARTAATSGALMGQSGKVTDVISRVASVRLNVPGLGSTQVVKFVMPFVRISSAIIEQALLQRSPLGVLDADVRANLMGRNGGAARDLQIAKITIGTSVMAAVAMKALNGDVAGSMPSDPKERAAWMATGKQENSIRIGGQWVQFNRLGPFGTLMGVAADMVQYGKEAGENDVGHWASMTVLSVVKSLADESWMKGPSDAMRAIDEPDQFGARYARNFLSSFLPYSSAMGEAARDTDPYLRQARTLVDVLKSKTPWLRNTLMPRRDIWGQPIPGREVVGVPGLSAIMESRVNNDPVTQEMIRLGNLPAAPKREMLGVALNDQQYDDYSAVRGQMMHQMLLPIVQMNQVSPIPDGALDRAMRDIVAKATQGAETTIKMRYPDIMRQAQANKVTILTEGRAAAARDRKAERN